MKKLIALVLSLVMVMGLATTAFAEEAGSKTLNEENGTSYDIKVEGKYIEKLMSDEIISVDVEWDAMNFTYAASFQGTWDPSSHSYTKDEVHKENGDWVDNSADIEVTNHSNVDVTASFEFKAETGFDKVTGSFAEATSASPANETDDGDLSEVDKGSAETQPMSVGLKAGEVGKKDYADNKTVTFTIGGELESSTTTLTKIGTITVSVKKTETTSDNG